MTTFANEPLLELRREAVRREALAALAALDAKLPLEVPMLIGEDVVERPPVRLGRPVARRPGSSPTPTRRPRRTSTDAVARAERGHAVWSRKPAAERAAALSRAAGILRARRLELTALAVREAGKPWAEADADVCEAIDFLEYYAHGALALDGGRPLLQLPGERNAMRYVARGVTGVIAPWNFPLAIAAGMVSAALATGNAVVLKPAEQTPACAKAVVDALHAGGVPLDALHAAARRRRGRQGARRRPAHPHDRVHRLLRRRPADPRARRQGRPGPAPPQARDRRDGRQERGHRRLRRRPRRRRPGAAEVRLRVRRPEVQRRLPRAGPRGRRRRAGRAAGRRRDDAARRPGRRLRHRRPAGHRHRRPAEDPALHRQRHAARPGRDPRRRLLRRADDLRRPAVGLPGRRRGDLRPGALARDRPEHRARLRPRRRLGRSPSPAASSPAARARSSTSATAPRSATSTSTARSPARWSAASPSAAAASPAPAPRPAARTTSCSSSRPARSPRTPSATASSSKHPSRGWPRAALCTRTACDRRARERMSAPWGAGSRSSTTTPPARRRCTTSRSSTVLDDDALKAAGDTTFFLTNTRCCRRRRRRSCTVFATARRLFEHEPDVEMISRSDSTLRGHVVAEVQAIERARRDVTGRGYDGVLLVPAFFEAGRFTAGRHPLGAVDGDVPVGETEFARDATFGYARSDLREFVAEKRGADEATSLSLDDIRAAGPSGRRGARRRQRRVGGRQRARLLRPRGRRARAAGDRAARSSTGPARRSCARSPGSSRASR